MGKHKQNAKFDGLRAEVDRAVDTMAGIATEIDMLTQVAKTAVAGTQDASDALNTAFAALALISSQAHTLKENAKYRNAQEVRASGKRSDNDIMVSADLIKINNMKTMQAWLEEARTLKQTIDTLLTTHAPAVAVASAVSYNPDNTDDHDDDEDDLKKVATIEASLCMTSTATPVDQASAQPPVSAPAPSQDTQTEAEGLAAQEAEIAALAHRLAALQNAQRIAELKQRLAEAEAAAAAQTASVNPVPVRFSATPAANASSNDAHVGSPKIAKKP